MITEIPANGALCFPHHFLGDIPSLGRRGVFFQQSHSDCGGAALKMVLAHHRITMDYGVLWRRLQNGPSGTTMLDIKRLAESAGLHCAGWRLSPADLFAIPLPAILLLHRRHFAVVAATQSSRNILLLDPVRGRLDFPIRRLGLSWRGETLLFAVPAKGAADDAQWFAGVRRRPRA